MDWSDDFCGVAGWGVVPPPPLVSDVQPIWACRNRVLVVCRVESIGAGVRTNTASAVVVFGVNLLANVSSEAAVMGVNLSSL